MIKLRKLYNNIRLGLLITATLFILGSGCGKNEDGSKPCSGGRYSFVATSEFSPQREIYNVGDTIFLNSTIPKNLYDIVSLQNIDCSSSLGIGGTIGFGYMDTVTNMGIDAYVIGVNNLGSQGLSGKDCTNAGFEMTVTNTNKNINLFQYALNYTPDAMLQKSIYCLRVR